MTTECSPKLCTHEGDVNFQALALEDPDFAQFLRNHGGRVDFQDAECVRQLTKSLLKVDFGLKLDLPHDRLCPPVPVRYSYIRWVQSLLASTSPPGREPQDSDRKVIGLDIGTGASCIYPLLAIRARPAWRMAATDIDEESVKYARRNIDQNGLQTRIRLLQTSPSGFLIPLDALQLERVDFTMCNPPFYSSRDEMIAAFAGSGKALPPSAVCTGADVEMVTDGGDAGFVLRMIDESKRIRPDRVQWYTSMLGKQSSLTTVVAKLKEVGNSNWAIGVLRGGGRTRRWVVAWSWQDFRPANHVARGDIPMKELLPFPTEFTIALGRRSADAVWRTVDDTLENLSLQWSPERTRMVGVGCAAGNVWSRSARRKQKKMKIEAAARDGETEADDDCDMEDEAGTFAFKCEMTPDDLKIRWLRGYDTVLFESFCGMIKRATDSISG